MQSLKNKFSAAKPVFSLLFLLLVPGGAALGQTVIDVDRNRFEGARAAYSGSTIINVLDGVTYTYEGAGQLRSDDGGALYVNGGVFTLGPATPGGTGRTVFIANQALHGGALAMTGNASVFLTNVRFGVLNRADSGNRAIGDHGGAIRVPNGVLTLDQAEFYRNVAQRGTPLTSASAGGGFGGAIAALGAGALEIRDSTFGALARPDPVDFFSAGWTPAYIEAISAANDRGSGNWAIDGSGGAIASPAAGATRISIYNSFFYHNTAVRGALNVNGSGGALYLGNGGGQQAYVEDTLFYGNRARGVFGGGAIAIDASGVVVTLKDSVFTNNYTTNNGGAIFLSAGRINLIATRDLAYTGNYAAAGVTDPTPSATKGGFLYLNGAATVNIDIAAGATLTIGAAANPAADTIAGAGATAVINVNSGSAAAAAPATADVAQTAKSAGSTESAAAVAQTAKSAGSTESAADVAQTAKSAGLTAGAALSGQVWQPALQGAATAAATDDAAAGTLILHGASTNFSGALNIHAGRVLLGGTAARFTSNNPVTVKTGGTFGGIGITRNVTVENGAVLQVGGAGIESADELYTYLDISGTLRLDDGAKVTGHGYIGTAVTIVNTDTLATANAIVLGTAAGDWATFDVAAGDTLSIVTGTLSAATATVTGAGGLVKTGDGDLRLYRSGGYTGGTRLEQGAIHINNASALGAGAITVTGSATRLGFMTGMDFANALDIAAGAAVELAANGDVSMQGAITGAGTLQKSGAHEFMLNTGAAAFTGTVIISGGILSGDINAASAVRLAAATYAGNLVRSTGQLLAGSGSISGNLALSGGRLSLDFRHSGTNGYSTDWLRVSGGVTSAGNNLINLDHVGTAAAYTLLRAADLTGLDPAHFTVATVNGEALTNRYDPLLTIADSGSALNVSPGVRNLRVTWAAAAGSAADVAQTAKSAGLTESVALSGRFGNLRYATAVAPADVAQTAKSARLTENAASSGQVWQPALLAAAAPAPVWSTTSANWTESSGERYFRDGDSVIFDPTATGAIAIDATGVTVGDLAIETAAGQTLAFTGGGITGTDALTDSDRHAGGADGLVYLGAGTTAAATGKLLKTGAGTLLLANAANTFAGGIELRAGTLAFDDGAQLGGVGQGIGITGDAALRADATATLAGNMTIAADKTATIDTRENTLDLTGTLTSAPTSKIAKAGPGDLWIYHTAHPAHHGATEIREGRLLLGGNADLGDGTVQVSAGATFGGHGTARNVTALAGSVLQAGTPDAAVAERLAVSSTLTLHAGAQLNFTIHSGDADPLASVNSTLTAGALTIAAGTPADLTIDLDRLASGTYDLGNLSTLAGAKITYSGQELGERQNITYASPADSGTLLIKIALPDNEEMRWTGAMDNNWNINTANWQIAASGSAYTFGDGDKLQFDGEADAAHPANRAITIAGRRMTLSDLLVTGTADYVFRGAAEIITDPASATPNLAAAAQGKLRKSGPGTLAFENAGNQFNGGIEITGGAISFTRTEQLRTNGAGITLDTGTLRAAAELLVLDEKITIAAGKTGAFDTSGGLAAGAADVAAVGPDLASGREYASPSATPGSTQGRALQTAAPAAGVTIRHTGTLDIAAGGTLTKTGAGTLELMGDHTADLAGTLAIEAGELLLRNDALTTTKLGGTVRVQTGGAFGGEGTVTGPVTVGQGGTLRIGTAVTGDEHLHLADLRLENGSAIQGAGLLTGAMTVGSGAGGLVTLNNIAGNPVTITATTSGPGTLVKAGGGVLTLSGTAALGHHETRVAGGLVYLRDIAPAEIPAVVHSFDLAGGWLDLSDARDYGDVPFITWDNLTFTGSAGGVIGHGDEIKLRDGDTGFQIGGSGTARGVFVVVDAGTGTATLSGSSNYVGYTRVDSGVLSVSHDTNLGNTDATIVAPRDVILNGGNLLAAAGFASERKIELRQAGTVIVNDGTASFADLSGTGAFTKAGEGTLFLTLPGGETDARTGAKTVAAGTLQGRAGTLAGLITNTGTVALYAAEDDSTGGVFTGTIAGGAFAKTGDGTADLGPTAAFAGLAALRVEEGVLTSAGRPLTLSAAASVDIGDRGTLSLPKGGTLTAALVRNQGMIRVGLGAGAAVPSETLTIHGDYLGGASAAAPGYLALGLGRVVEGRVIEADTFHVTGSAAGTTYVTFARQTANDPYADNLAARAGSLPENVIRVDGGGGEFLQSGRLTYGVKDYVLIYEPDTGTSRWRISLASEIPALVAVDAALMLAEHASLAGLTQRLETMGLLDGYKGRQGFDLWANGIYRRDKFSDTIYSGATADTRGWQAGVDYTDANLSFALGIFVEKISTTTDMPRVPGAFQQATRTESDTDGFGAYITYRPSRWFFNLLIRLNTGRYDIDISETPTFGTDTGGAGVSVDIGRYYDLGAGWLLEPQLQFQWSRSNVDNTKDSVPVAGIDDPRTNHHREYRVRALEYSSLRGGLMLSRRLVTRRGWEVRPYARASYAGEFGGDTEMTVYTIGEEIPYRNTLGGAYGALNGGATLRIRDRLDLWADLAWYYAGKIDGHSLNLGAGWRF